MIDLPGWSVLPVLRCRHCREDRPHREIHIDPLGTVMQCVTCSTWMTK